MATPSISDTPRMMTPERFQLIKDECKLPKKAKWNDKNDDGLIQPGEMSGLSPELSRSLLLIQDRLTGPFRKITGDLAITMSLPDIARKLPTSAHFEELEPSSLLAMDILFRKFEGEWVPVIRLNPSLVHADLKALLPQMNERISAGLAEMKDGDTQGERLQSLVRETMKSDQDIKALYQQYCDKLQQKLKVELNPGDADLLVRSLPYQPQPQISFSQTGENRLVIEVNPSFVIDLTHPENDMAAVKVFLSAGLTKAIELLDNLDPKVNSLSGLSYTYPLDEDIPVPDMHIPQQALLALNKAPEGLNIPQLGIVASQARDYSGKALQAKFKEYFPEVAKAKGSKAQQQATEYILSVSDDASIDAVYRSSTLVLMALQKQRYLSREDFQAALHALVTWYVSNQTIYENTNLLTPEVLGEQKHAVLMALSSFAKDHDLARSLITFELTPKLFLAVMKASFDR